jgi:ribonucleoside-diphosphate reductase subunit M1
MILFIFLIHILTGSYATKKSAELGLKDGSYKFFHGSPISKGILQPDLWNVTPIMDYKWDELRELCKISMRNSLLIAPMPTASTAQILGNNESIEMFTNMIYSRRVLSGDHILVNKYLVSDLRKLNLWNREIVNQIIMNEGSIQSIEIIPSEIKKIYRTVWEMSQNIIIQLAADRAAFIDQTQSLNIFMTEPTIRKLATLHMKTFELGLKTGMYYLRTKGSRSAIKFTIIEKIPELREFKSKTEFTQKTFMCNNDDVCIMCSA